MDARRNYTEEYDPQLGRADFSPRINIVGAGVVGLACALNLAQYTPNIHIFEKSHPSEWNRLNTSSVAAAEFLPLIHDHNNPFAQEQYELIEKVMPASWKVYEDLASLDPQQSGVRAVTLIEPTNELERWPSRLEKIMKARLYKAEKPLVLERLDGQEYEYPEYYKCKSYAIDPVKLMAHYRRALKYLTTWHHEEIIPEELDLLGGVTIQATGTSATDCMHDKRFSSDWGASTRVEGYTAPPVMISVGDMIIAPHQGVLVFGGGEFYGGPPSNERLEAFTRRLRALASVAIGDWEPLPREVRARIGDDGFRVSERPTIVSGLTVRRNPYHPWVVDANGLGHAGITLAGGVAEKAGKLARTMLREHEHEQRKGE